MISLTIRSRIVSAAAMACGLLAAALPAFAQDYDLVILDGRVMGPETGYHAVANVGVEKIPQQRTATYPAGGYKS
jgi:hypothetical protein